MQKRIFLHFLIADCNLHEAIENLPYNFFLKLSKNHADRYAEYFVHVLNICGKCEKKVSSILLEKFCRRCTSISKTYNFEKKFQGTFAKTTIIF